MIYKVFLDTNIYDASNYSFSNVTFSGLKSYAKKGIVQLQINSVVEGEVQGHIKERVTSAVKGVNKALKEAAFAGFRTMPDFQEKMKKFNESEWVSKAEGEFQKLLVECGITRISVNGINVEKIMNDYFNKRLPFENKKPDEFKDAIAIESIIAEVKKLTADEIYCVISNDKGFANAVKQYVKIPEQEEKLSTVELHNERLQVFDNLRSFLDYLNKLKKRSEYLAAFLQNEEVASDIEDTIRYVLERIDYQIENKGHWIEEKDVADIDDIEFKTYVLDVYDDDTAAISLDAKAIVYTTLFFIRILSEKY
ncbi:MAG: PIN domain-containing protein [Fusicatenibacter sp.]